MNFVSPPLQSEGKSTDSFIYGTEQADEHDTQGADEQAGTGIVVAAESRDGFVARVDVHGLDYLQVVVQGDDGVGQGLSLIHI